MTQQIQSFHVKGGPDFGRDHLPLLRQALNAAGLDAFVIPHEDEYNNEYLPANAERLMWATGFTGSAGAAIVATDTAAVFVDGRYTEQVKSQVDPDLFEYADLVALGVAGWIRSNAKPGWTIGYDARLHSPDALAKLTEAADRAGATMKAVDANPVDAAWSDRPEPPRAKVRPHTIEAAGEAHADKRRRVAGEVAETGADAAVITDPASIAWLFNLRGGDVACTPLAAVGGGSGQGRARNPVHRRG